MAVGGEAVIADAMKAVGQRVHQEAPDELAGGEAHHLGRVGLAVILPAEAHLVGRHRDQSTVADRDAVRVAGEVGENPALVRRRGA